MSKARSLPSVAPPSSGGVRARVTVEYDRARWRETDRPSSEINQFSTDAFFWLVGSLFFWGEGGLTLFKT